MFGISNDVLMDKNIVKIIDGIAGSGKSTSTVNTLRQLNSNFCLASFSNALKFAARDKFGCPVDTICGLAFINSPYPRSFEKDVTEFDTVVLDEILLDGVKCLEWIQSHVSKVNIICLTDSRQMLNAESGKQTLRAYNKLVAQPYVLYTCIDQTKRAVDKETKQMYSQLFSINSEATFNVDEAASLLHCDIIDAEMVDYYEDATYICHSNKIEHDLYKRYNICDRRDIKLIPKHHIARNENFNPDRYPICDQLTATDKSIQAYLQAYNIASPTRYQGREVNVGDQCYFFVEPGSVFKGREIYTVGTRCKSVSSLHIVMIRPKVYNDPEKIWSFPVVSASRLDIKRDDKSFKPVNEKAFMDVIKEYGSPDKYYLTDVITSGKNILYSTLPIADLEQFANVNRDISQAVFKDRPRSCARSIASVTRRDQTMNFDFMPRVYEILNGCPNPPRIENPSGSRKKSFTKLFDINSAFATILSHAVMPKAGMLYEEYDPDKLNFYVYTGDKLKKFSVITEDLAKEVGDSRYVFSTDKQIGCDLGRYTYSECFRSKERKKQVSMNFKWGILYKHYYERTECIHNGEKCTAYVKHSNNNLELVACALWSALCLIMINVIKSLNLTNYYVVTDGVFYESDGLPDVPDWCDYRILVKDWEDEDKSEKYKNIIYQTYEDLPTEKEAVRKSNTDKKREARARAKEELKQIREGRV